MEFRAIHPMHPIRRSRRSAWIAAGLLAAATALPGATITVTTLADVSVGNDGHCSLREAIEAANDDAAFNECPAGDGADVIEFSTTGTIQLNADLQEISGPLTVTGPGRDLLIVDGGLLHAGFRIDAIGGELLEISGLTITRAFGGFGAAVTAAIDDSVTLTDVAITDCEAAFGAGIYADDAGEIRVLRSELSGNRGNNGGGGLYLSTSALLFVQDSTIAENFAGPDNGTTDSHGGGIYVVGTEFEIRRSTISGNGARGHGGGLMVFVSPGLVRNSTIVANFADPDGDGHSGGGLRIENVGGEVVQFGGTIVALNTDGSASPERHRDFSLLDGEVATLSYNWIGENESVEAAFPLPTVPGQPNLSADFVGEQGAALDPVLSALVDNGGPTRTHRPLLTSPIVDQGNCPVSIQDQRGYGNPDTGLRVVDDPAIPNLADGCDPGAVERGGQPLDGMPFLDGFESGDTADWSSTVG